jgi:trimeric autotransporter adhesin
MAKVQTIIVGGGINPGVPFVVPGLLFVQQANPPVVASSPVAFQVLAPLASQAIVINQAFGDPQPAATEPLRVVGGIISEKAGLADWWIGGRNTTVAGANPSIVIGSNTVAGSGQVVLGDQVNGGGNAGTVCIGRQSSALGGSGTCINGLSLRGGAAVSVAIQGSILTGNGSSVSIGGQVSGSGDNGVQVGMGGSLQGFDAVCIGHNANVNATGAGGVAVGGANGGLNTRVFGAGGIAVGFGAQADNTGCIVIGSSISGGSSKATHDQCIIIGSGVATVGANMAFLGGAQTVINTVIIGRAFSTSVGATPVTIQLTARQGAGNLAGSDFTLQSGPGVGNDLTAGWINFKTPITAAGGTTQGTGTRMQIMAGGGVLVGAPDAAGFTLALTGFGGAAQPAVSITNLTNGAAAAAGTLLNAPAAGNPTFWIPFSINGVVRYVPSW